MRRSIGSSGSLAFKVSKDDPFKEIDVELLVVESPIKFNGGGGRRDTFGRRGGARGNLGRGGLLRGRRGVHSPKNLRGNTNEIFKKILMLGLSVKGNPSKRYCPCCCDVELSVDAKCFENVIRHFLKHCKGRKDWFRTVFTSALLPTELNWIRVLRWRRRENISWLWGESPSKPSGIKKPGGGSSTPESPETTKAFGGMELLEWFLKNTVNEEGKELANKCCELMCSIGVIQKIEEDPSDNKAFEPAASYKWTSVRPGTNNACAMTNDGGKIKKFCEGDDADVCNKDISFGLGAGTTSGPGPARVLTNASLGGEEKDKVITITDRKMFELRGEFESKIHSYKVRVQELETRVKELQEDGDIPFSHGLDIEAHRGPRRVAEIPPRPLLRRKCERCGFLLLGLLLGGLGVLGLGYMTGIIR